MLTAASLIAQAAQDAHVPNYTAQGLVKLQIILDELCLVEDFALARGVYYFPLNPTLITTIAGFTNFGGPYPLPLDYLRTSGSSGEDGRQTGFFYVYNGVPYPLTPVDLGRGDMLVQQPGLQNLPGLFYTDISTETTAQDRIAGSTTAQVTSGSANITVASASRMLAGMGVAGLGIAAGSTILTIANTTVTLSLPATGSFTGVGTGGTSGAGAASLMFGTQPNAYVWPGPSGAFPTTLRYQRLMPPLLDTGRVPWFPDQSYLLVRLAADLMTTSDDTRRDKLLVDSERILGRYKGKADDKTNRSQVVQLDRQSFGAPWRNLKQTKTVGW